MIGKKISHYRILEKLGEGGMGMVYKAEDTKLKRIVALKFLPAASSLNEEAKKRFINEAQTASSLQHNNICTIHDIDETDDKQIYICMDYYEGETLMQKIERGHLEIDEAVDIISQVIAGLEKAHEKGIIHRDIKPANIFITKDGVVKILDFGLAKLSGRTTMTKMGYTLGTVAYMSPEQARGTIIDKRTDIWSLGVMLYEMLTGQLPFKADYDQALIYLILNEKPEPIQKFLPNISPENLIVIDRSIEKNPDNRYQSLSEMADDLQKLKNKSGTSMYPTAGLASRIPVQQRTVSSKITKKKLFWDTGFVAFIIMAIVLYLVMFNQSVELNPAMSMQILSTPYPIIGRPDISADDNWIAFPAEDNKDKWDIYFMNTSGGEPRRITFDSSVFIPSAEISPDGSMIAYSTRKDKGSWNEPDLFVVSTLGGRRRMIVEKANGPCWTPDGKRIFFTGTKKGIMEVFSVKPDCTDRRIEFRDTLGAWEKLIWEGGVPWSYVSLSISPDEKSIVYPRTFKNLSLSKEPYQELIIHNLETGNEKQLTFNKKYIGSVYWARNNQIIFSSDISGNLNLWSIPADGGNIIQVTKNAGLTDWGIKASADCKKLIYIQGQSVCYLWRGSLINGSTQQLSFDNRSKYMPRISPDGKSLVFIMEHSDPQRNEEALYLSDNKLNGTHLITPFAQYYSYIINDWSPDGKWISFNIFNNNLENDSIGYFKTYIISSEEGSKPIFIANGGSFGWVNDTTLRIFQKDSVWYQSINSEKHRISPLGDSLLIYRYVLNKNYVVYWDLHKGHGGIWIAAVGPDYTIKGKRINLSAIMGNIAVDFRITENALFYIEVLKEPLWEIKFPECKKMLIPWTFKGIGQMRWSVTNDGKEIYWDEIREQRKLILIKNPFK